MLIIEIVAEILGPVLRVIAWFFYQIVFELIIQGTGYLVMRLMRSEPEPNDTVCTIVGVLFWLVVGSAGFFIYQTVKG